VERADGVRVRGRHGGGLCGSEGGEHGAAVPIVLRQARVRALHLLLLLPPPSLARRSPRTWGCGVSDPGPHLLSVEEQEKAERRGRRRRGAIFSFGQQSTERTSVMFR
jgi:hypothetical protein